MGTEPERPPAAEPAPAAFHYGAGHMIMHGNLVYTTGKPGACRLTTAAGKRRLVVAPRRDPDTGKIYGVTTHLRPVAD
jgi:hypothetical protein